jgi:hypothetical protein
MMTDDMGTPLPPVAEPKKRNTVAIIIVIILAVILLCCCCLAASAWLLWNNGDQWFGPYLVGYLVPLLV